MFFIPQIFHPLKALENLPTSTTFIQAIRAIQTDFEACHNRNPVYLVFKNLDTGEEFKKIPHPFFVPYLLENAYLNRFFEVNHFFIETDQKVNFEQIGIWSVKKLPIRLKILKEQSKRIKNFIAFFSGHWDFYFLPNKGIDFDSRVLKFSGKTYNGKNKDDIAYPFSSEYQKWKNSVLKKYKDKFLKSCSKYSDKSAQHLKQIIKQSMKEELPKIEKLDEILTALIQVESDYLTKYDALTAQYEHKQANALAKQEKAFEQRLKEAEQRHQSQQLETQEQIAQLHSLINKTYEQNEQLLTNQQEQAKGYESQLFNLMAQLKQEL